MPYLILYIEDESAIVELVKIIVQHTDIELIASYSAALGLRIARERIPDLIMLDVMIPDRSGWSVFHEIRGDKHLSATPIIMLTGQMHRYQIKKEFEKSKIDAYITKPFDVMSVRVEIEKMLGYEFWSRDTMPKSRRKVLARANYTNGKPI